MQDLHLTGIIEESSRLVKIDHGCLLGQGFGNHHLLSFTIRERLHHPLTQFLDSYHLDALSHHFLVILVQSSPKARIRCTTQRHQFANRHVLHIRLGGQYHSNQSGYLTVGELGEILFVNIDLSTQRWLEGAEGAEQG